ncbi:RNA-guided endonuclease TnpB family protein [Kitasatospora sp. NPDC097605]|uniref:RNA-guided endonuclease InsQ/TnpB family protein n=1 Tax=Kitasatospora sp. NPDC097605 TaxID=3157226 RepID=UPI0033327A39
MRQEVLRAFRFTLDPTAGQLADLNRHAGAARWAFNWALGKKVAAHREWRRQVDDLVAWGTDEKAARKAVKARTPNAAVIKKNLNAIKGDSRKDRDLPDGFHGPFLPCPWWHEVSTYAFQSAFIDADAAWKNWIDSLAGRRAGRAVGYPRFKRKGRAKDSFRLHHDVKKPTIRLDNPRHLAADARRLTKAQRILARTQRGSNRRRRAALEVGRIQHQTAERRATGIHQLTKRLATGFATVAVEDLNVTGMSSSARGTAEAPGRRVRQKAGLNRAVLDAAPGELRRQLSYKTSWYGSRLAVLDRWHPSSKTCSACGTVKSKLSLSEREYHCTTCGLMIDRDLNAALIIARHAVPLVEGDAKAHRSPVGPAGDGRHGRAARQTREGPPPGGSPRRE